MDEEDKRISRVKRRVYQVTGLDNNGAPFVGTVTIDLEELAFLLGPVNMPASAARVQPGSGNASDPIYHNGGQHDANNP